ncbi:MAG: TonB family protein [Xanthomonadales bacterium]|nr:TonB family protein [Xanthomonadales bacterium]
MRMIRMLGSASFGALLTLVVFYFMFSLVARADVHRSSTEPVPGIVFGPVELPDEVIKKPKIPPPPKPKPIPPQPQMEPLADTEITPDLPPLEVDLPPIGTGIVPGKQHTKLSFPSSDSGELTRLVYAPPAYPPQAAAKGIEGWVRVAFTVGPDGRVSKPSVVEAYPSSIFNKEAIRAVLKWKFKPQVVEGVAESRRVVQQIDFALSQG